jgi:hypothetical protein
VNISTPRPAGPIARRPGDLGPVGRRDELELVGLLAGIMSILLAAVVILGATSPL